MYTLGLNIYHADSSACLFKDGELICGFEEERLNRIKHWSGIPFKSIERCLSIQNITIDQVNYISINSNPASNFKLKILSFFSLRNKIFHFFSFFKRQKIKLSLKNELEKKFKTKITAEIKRFDHHLSHIASGYFLSSFNKAITVSIDGFGDFLSLNIAKCENENIKILKKISYPDSLGVFYEGFTQFLGFKNYGDEYKLMGLSAYGKPKYTDEIKKTITQDRFGFYKLNLNFFNHIEKNFKYSFDGTPKSGDLLKNDKILKLLNLGPNDLDQFEIKADIASSVQRIYEEILFDILNYAYKNFGEIDNLVLTGGCAMNSLANGKILKNTKFKEIFIPFAPGDNGGCIGSAILLNKKIVNRESVKNPYCGIRSKISIHDLELKCKKKSFSIKNFENINELNVEVCKLLMNSNIVARFSKNMEFGSRALGNSSILCDPRLTNAKDIINKKVKLRESFRPFAPSILEEKITDWFESDIKSPYMSFVLKIKENKKSIIPAVCHVDGTGRLQTVNQKFNEDYYNLISLFEEFTGVPILLNTSFNENEPIVEDYSTALNTFERTDIDYLIIDNNLISKNA